MVNNRWNVESSLAFKHGFQSSTMFAKHLGVPYMCSGGDSATTRI